jgi:hypothetical protein
MLLTGVLVGLFVTIVLANVVLTSAMSQHRTDLPRNAPPASGPSWSWQINAFVHARYDARGQTIKRWVIALIAVQGLLAITLVVRFAW